MMSRMNTAAEASVFDDRRSAVRMRCKPVDLQLETSVFVDMVRLINVGRLGFSVGTPIAYPPGTPLKLHIPGRGALSGRAVWYSRNQLGARFDEPLDEKTMLSLTEEG